jgi:hypothetical protein
MFRRPAPVRLSLSILGVAAALFALALGGCYSNDAVEPAGGSADPAPVITTEPLYSPGHENTVSWSVSVDGNKGRVVWEFLVQRSSDPQFAQDVEESGWTGESSFEFTGLEHGSAHYYRVRGRHPWGADSPWSPTQTSTQDAVSPVSELTELIDEQNSLLFTFELSATDETSGVQEIELWFSLEGGEPSLYGAFPPGVVTFQAVVGGNHAFFPVAVDAAGNRQERGTAPSGTTLVPEPIIITDRRGEDFDITSAVLEFRMAVQYWEFGLGRYTIRPVINPRLVASGEPGYPRPNDMTDVCAVKFEDDIRAYKLHDMNSHEVVDDVVNGVPIAVAY